jgi:hypothetical protein
MLVKHMHVFETSGPCTARGTVLLAWHHDGLSLIIDLAEICAMVISFNFCPQNARQSFLISPVDDICHSAVFMCLLLQTPLYERLVNIGCPGLKAAL